MTLVALVTDTHAGVRGDNQNFAAYQRKFWLEVFYPKIDELGIKTVIHLGDIVDRRKYIEFLTAKNLREDVIEPSHQRGLDFHVIIGNHDTRFKGTNEVNVMDMMFRNSNYPGLKWYSEAEDVLIHGKSVLFMPWINSGNREYAFKKIAESKSDVLMGHLELNGFEMYKGTINDHGDDPKLFDKFDQVMSGHFHHRSKNRNINYLGAPFEMTWSDYGDPKGFHIWNTETGDLDFIENPFRMFHKLFYDDLNKEMDQAIYIPDGLDGTYVKVIVKNKVNPYWFDLYIDRLEKTGALNVQVVDDNLNLSSSSDEELVNQTEDTLSIMLSFAKQLGDDDKVKPLENLMRDLYSEALTVE